MPAPTPPIPPPPPSNTPHPDVTIPPDIWRSVLIVMERLAASSNLDEVLGLIIDSLRDCLAADRASVFQYDPPRPPPPGAPSGANGGGHELFATRAHGVDRSLRFSADLGLAGEAVRTRRIVNVPDCYADPRFNPDIDRRTGYRTRCMLTIPLMSFDGALEGVAQVLNKREVPSAECRVPSALGPADSELGTRNSALAFTASDETIARALASQAAVAIRRARLIEAELRKLKLEADLRIAREMQIATLPATIPAVPGYDIAAANRQAEETGGDTYDLVPVGGTGLRPVSDGGTGLRPVSKPGILILMADATGHGIGPALSATQVQSMLRMAARLAAPLEQTVTHLNALMADALPAGRFVTAFVGILEPRLHRIRYISAGQAPIVVVRADGAIDERSADVAPLGVDLDLKSPPVSTINMHPGDTLLLLSDGYYEHTDAARHQFGVDRIVESVRAATTSAATSNAADAILAALDRAVAAFSANRPAIDDQTALIIRRRPS